MGSRHELLPSQEEALFKLIVAVKFDPEQFSFDKEAYSTVFRYKTTNYYFQFSRHAAPNRGDWLKLTYSPSQYLTKEEETSSIDDWPKLLSYFRSWLAYLRRELNTKNPWDDILKQKELSEAASTIGEENTPFTSDEISLISSKLAELKDLFIAKGLVDEEHHALVESRLRYLESGTKKLGRVDWANVVYATVVKLAVEKVLDTTAFQAAVEWMRCLFQKILVGTRYLPPPL